MSAAKHRTLAEVWAAKSAWERRRLEEHLRFPDPKYPDVVGFTLPAKEG